MVTALVLSLHMRRNAVIRQVCDAKARCCKILGLSLIDGPHVVDRRAVKTVRSAVLPNPQS
jgi:hypothetical protein